MSNSTGPSIYFAHDKSIHDALHNQRVTAKILSGFLRSKGILVSPKEGREALIKVLIRSIFDFYDLNEVFSWMDQHSRKERKELKEVAVVIGSQEVVAACTALKHEALPGESISVKTLGSSTYIEINYSDVDYSKAELRQRVPKKCVIEVEQTTSGLKLRKPQNDKASEYEERILRKIEEKVGPEKTFEKREISLLGISDPQLKSRFFIELANGIDGFELEDISLVKTNKAKPEKFDEDDSMVGDEVVLVGYINDAVLNGVDVIKSSHFATLAKDGFHITRMVWSATSKLPDGERVEMEAAFAEPNSCSKFSYKIRSVFHKKKGTLEFNTSGRPPSATEEKELSRKIEESAKSAAAAVGEEAS